MSFSESHSLTCIWTCFKVIIMFPSSPYMECHPFVTLTGFCTPLIDNSILTLYLTNNCQYNFLIYMKKFNVLYFIKCFYFYYHIMALLKLDYTCFIIKSLKCPTDAEILVAIRNMHLIKEFACLRPLIFFFA